MQGGGKRSRQTGCYRKNAGVGNRESWDIRATSPKRTSLIKFEQALQGFFLLFAPNSTAFPSLKNQIEVFDEFSLIIQGLGGNHFAVGAVPVGHCESFFGGDVGAVGMPFWVVSPPPPRWPFHKLNFNLFQAYFEMQFLEIIIIQFLVALGKFSMCSRHSATGSFAVCDLEAERIASKGVRNYLHLYRTLSRPRFAWDKKSHHWLPFAIKCFW